jgi:hypothetical protein
LKLRIPGSRTLWVECGFIIDSNFGLRIYEFICVGTIEFALEFGAETEVFGDVVIDVLFILIPLPKKFLLYPIEFFYKE